jgi:hypothetical protein
MRSFRRLLPAILVVSLSLPLTGCFGTDAGSGETAKSTSGGFFGTHPAFVLPEGTPISVRLTTYLSSKTSKPGDPWNGVVTAPVTVGDRVAVEPGAYVHGVVSSAREAEQGDRAELGLAVREILVHGRYEHVDATSAPVVAGSPRARNVGAIAGSAAAGALIGHAVGGDGHGALVGGLVGGAAATGAVAASKGYQVELHAGVVMRFTVNQQVAVR